METLTFIPEMSPDIDRSKDCSRTGKLFKFHECLA